MQKQQFQLFKVIWRKKLDFFDFDKVVIFGLQRLRIKIGYRFKSTHYHVYRLVGLDDQDSRGDVLIVLLKIERAIAFAWTRLDLAFFLLLDLLAEAQGVVVMAEVLLQVLVQLHVLCLCHKVNHRLDLLGIGEEENVWSAFVVHAFKTTYRVHACKKAHLL